MCQGPQAVLDVDFPRRDIVLTGAYWILSSHSGRVNRPQATVNPKALDATIPYLASPSRVITSRTPPGTQRHLTRSLRTFGSPQNTTQLYFIQPTDEDEAHPSCKGASQRLLRSCKGCKPPAPKPAPPPPSHLHPARPNTTPRLAARLPGPDPAVWNPPLPPPQVRRVASREPQPAHPRKKHRNVPAPPEG